MLVDELGFVLIDVLVVVPVPELSYVRVQALVCVPVEQHFLCCCAADKPLIFDNFVDCCVSSDSESEETWRASSSSSIFAPAAEGALSA